METTTTFNKKRPSWKWILVFVASAFLGMGGYTVLQVLALNYASPLIIVIATAIILGLYALGVKLLEGHWPHDLGMGKLMPHTFTGLLVGFVFMTLVVSTIVATGCATINSQAFTWGELVKPFMLYLTVAVGEEMVFRGILFRQVDERWNTGIALIVSALVFGLIHLPNQGATMWSSLAIAIEAGLMLAAAYKWSGTLWVPIGIHWAWNFTQGNVFGLAVSGICFGDTMLTTTVNGPDIITGGAFGPEASIIAVIFGTVITLIFLCNRYRS